jgi:hypothetical protein
MWHDDTETSLVFSTSNLHDDTLFELHFVFVPSLLLLTFTSHKPRAQSQFYPTAKIVFRKNQRGIEPRPEAHAVPL